MKNLLIYISPEHKFLPEYEKLVRIQIDNSLDLGWKIEDIMLVLNFFFEYAGVRSIVVGDENICPFYMYSGKINTLIDLWNRGLIKENEIYWYHDFDAFQNYGIIGEELGIESVDIGYTDYGRKPNWNGGSNFFKYGAKDIFGWMKERIYRNPSSQPIKNHAEAYHAYSDESAIRYLMDINHNNINSRIKRLDSSYNFNLNPITIRECYDKVLKPVRVFHFHKEKLPIAKKFLNEGLINLFNRYNYGDTTVG